MSCIAEPISWLRLERHALGEHDAAVVAHLAACATCRTCADAIAADTGELPALRPAAVIPIRKKRPLWQIAAPACALAAAAVIALVVISRPPPRERDRFAVKGGELVLGLVRERAGAIADDATTFRPTDRWKVVVTCPPGEALTPRVSVVEVGGTAPADHPLLDTVVACGNRVVLPGAFTLTGPRPNQICVTIGEARACRAVTPELIPQ